MTHNISITIITGSINIGFQNKDHKDIKYKIIRSKNFSIQHKS